MYRASPVFAEEARQALGRGFQTRLWREAVGASRFVAVRRYDWGEQAWEEKKVSCFCWCRSARVSYLLQVAVGQNDKADERALTVRLVSARESSKDVVRALRSLARDVEEGADPCKASKLLRARLLVEEKDPELILSFNGDNRDGFLPLHTASSEIFNVGRLENLNFSAFVGWMKRYGKVQKRNGR